MMKVYRLMKRIIDFCVSLFCLILSSPFLLLLAFSILISAGRPVVYCSQRLGKDKKSFTVYKFRTLMNGLQRRSDGLSDKVVVNRLAKFMRDTHLDEVLQLINVVKGDMALIGPRPLDVPRYQYLKNKDSSWNRVLKFKPGMTCINQFARYSSGSMDKVRKLRGLRKLQRRNRLVLDKYYMRNESLFLDLRITFWTVGYLISGFFAKLFRREETNQRRL